MHSNWKQTPILAEISEYIADGNETNFWGFVKKVQVQRIGNISNNTEHDQYEIGISIAEQILSPSKINLLRLALSTRMMSPRVEIHRQLGAPFQPEHCTSFFVFGAQSGCHLSKLNIGKQDETSTEVFEFDHIYPTNSIASKTLVLYGELGSDQLNPLLLGAKALADSEDDVRFVFRHFKPTTPDQSPVSLSGYGVELAIKNTEYKAVDSNKSNDEPENLHGLNFKILNEKHLNQRKELESLRDHLEKMGEIAPLKLWQIHDLGFKTCQKMKMGLELNSAEKVLQDFPVHSRAISHINVDERFRKSVKIFQKKMNEKQIESGMNILAINGRVVAKGDKHIDLFSLMEVVKQEQQTVEDVANMGLKSDIDFSRLLTAVDLSPIESSVYALDYRDTLPHYLNDLESNRGRYTSLELLLQPFSNGQIRPISRNIFTLILFCDPFDSNDLLFEAIQNYHKAGVYIRFGVVPVFDEKRHGISVQEAVGKKTVAREKSSLWPTKTSLLNAIQNNA
ncbi:unnamed protein product [Caenorhabditis sp. 36 PRJEB53466]|nr:unnamed protein product [Caenorhabditis sp. 36 PRJEB53466]